MSELRMSRATWCLAAISMCLGAACARPYTAGASAAPQEGAGVRAGPVATDGVSKELASLGEQLKVERSFAAFLEGLRSSQAEAVPWQPGAWERVGALLGEYQTAVDEAGAVFMSDAADAEDPERSGARLEELSRRFNRLRERRLELSGAIAEHVIGLDPAKTATFLDEGSVLEVIRTGREAFIPVGSGEPPTERQTTVLRAMAELDPQARDEVSFGWFVQVLWLDGPGVFVPGYIEKWDISLDVISDYTSSASVYPGELWFYLQPQGLRKEPAKLQEILALCSRELPRLREQRFKVSEAILKDVFGISDPRRLHEVATGEVLVE